MTLAVLALAALLSTSAGAATGYRPAPQENGEGAGPRFQVGYDEGFFLRTADGRNEFVIEGLMQTVFAAYGSDREPRTDFELKRIRPEFAGKLANVVRFRIEPKFSAHETELEEAWLGADLFGGDARLMIGRMKVPFNLEEIRSRRHIDFPRFSIINQFAPAEDHGVFLIGHTPSERWEYGIALYNGTGDSDANSSKEAALHLMAHPFVQCEDSPLRNLQVGLAGTFGLQDEVVAGDAIENAAGLPVVHYAPGVMLDGPRWRAGIEAAWFDGPWFAQAEYFAMGQDMSLAGVDENVAIHGGYLDLSYVLSGESKSFAGVSPSSPVDLEHGSGSGAWIAALRLSTLELDGDLEKRGFALPGTFCDHIRSLSLGLNWVLNDHAIVRTSYVHSFYGQRVALDAGSARHEGALMVEFQVHF